MPHRSRGPGPRQQEGPGGADTEGRWAEKVPKEVIEKGLLPVTPRFLARLLL